ncbi:MAG: secretin N-terminal domain-containing protein [Planctomycetota bacterium]|nr:secretin N-terminal domain-containing protein [Planctomycetota bacterium]
MLRSLTLLLLTSLLPALAFQADDAAPVPPIQSEGEFYVINISEDPNNGLQLEQFVKLCQEATGFNFTYTTETQALLAQQQVRLLGTKRIPKRDFYSWFQIMMVINNFACVEIGPVHLSVIQIQSLQASGGNRGTIKTNAKMVDPEDVADYADQPATLITTTVTLKNTDVRQLSTNLRPLLQDPATENIMNAGQSNSLILTGFGSKIASVVRLLEVIDAADAPEDVESPVFDIVPMEFASADDVSEILDELLEARRNAVQTAAQEGRNPSGTPAATGRTPEAKVMVQGRTNSLLVMAMPDEMPMIKEMIARLDVDVIEPERNYHVYALQNVEAATISPVLDDFLQDASALAESSTGTGGRAGQAATTSSKNDVVVVADETTNSLLIAANKTRYAEVLDLIQLLDRRQDQVLIETALIELSGSNLFDLGVELGFADLPGINQIGGFGVTSFGLSTIEDLDPVDGIPDSKVPNLGTGFTFGILDGEDFALPMLVKAAETNANANVLNIPSVLVSNNGSATVSTVDSEPYSTTTALGQSASTATDLGGYQEAGITMNISPSISASRYLRLGIELTISSFGNKTDQSLPPPITRRNLTTTVNVPDGDTMVIGGIITDNKSESVSKFPLLGDLPGVGFLFRNTQRSGTRTSLYFFVTPHILHDEDFADLAEHSYRAKQDAAERIGLDRIRMIDGSFSVDDELFSLEAFQLPRFQAPASGEVSPEEVGLDPQRRNDLLEAARKGTETMPPAEPVEVPVEAELVEPAAGAEG